MTTDYSGYYNSYEVGDSVEMVNRWNNNLRETGIVYEKGNDDETFVNVKNEKGTFKTGPTAEWKIVRVIEEAKKGWWGGRSRRSSNKRKSVRRKLIKKKSVRRKAW